MLCSQVENLARPWNWSSLRKANSSPSCKASSQSRGSRSMRLAVRCSRGMHEANRSSSSACVIFAGRA
jgi:hypothetical protein